MDFFSVLSHLDWSQVGQLTLQHLLLVLVAVGLAILVDVPLGVLMTRFTWLAGPLQGAATVMLTIPSIALFGLALLLTLARLVKGPCLPDRALALDTLYVNAIALLVLYGIWRDSDLFFEAALLIAVLGFVGTVAVAKYMLRGDIIE